MTRRTRNILGIILAIMIGIWIMTLFLDKARTTFLNTLLTESSNLENIKNNLGKDKEHTINNTNYISSNGEIATPESISPQIITDILVPINTDSTHQNNKENSAENNIREKTLIKNPNLSGDSATPLVLISDSEGTSEKQESNSLEQKIKEYESRKKNEKALENSSNPEKLSKNSMLNGYNLAGEQKNRQKLRKQHITNLEKIYKEKKKSSDLKKLIQELVKNYEFEAARKYLKSINITKNTLVSTDLYVYTYFNILDISDENDRQKFMNKITALHDNNKLNDQDFLFYHGLLKIGKRDYSAAHEIWQKNNESKYTSLILNIKNIQERMKTKSDIPPYYQDALIGLEMLKSGYFSLGKELAMYAMSQNEKYILPYQILAYSDFLTNNLNSCITYFQKLTKKDPAKHNSYKYMMAISYYWLGDYSNAILHLNQLKNIKEFRIDVLRYLALGYKSINDYQRMIEIYGELSQENNLVSQDFSEFFNSIFVIPYEQYGKIKLEANASKIAITYINRCQRKKSIDQNVCLLGIVGKYAFQNKRTPDMLKTLKKLIQVYNQNFSLQLLGDYYRYTNNYKLSNKYYLKATLTTDSQKEKEVIQKKLILLRDFHKDFEKNF